MRRGRAGRERPALPSSTTLLTPACGGLSWLGVGTVRPLLAGAGEGWVRVIEIER